jgi:NAD-dependent dihydropyrimidine dehydrogenase PreA subunit
MLRKIIVIDEERCNGCGLCADACHEGAIDIVDGKAKLMRENFCDGLGDCLPACPMNAISFEMREAPGYDEQAVLEAKRKKTEKTLQAAEGEAPNALDNWPVQLFLVSSSSPVFHNCDLLIAADCTAYAYGNFHRDFVAGRTTVIGCPKLDEGDYAEKLTAILANNDIKSVTIVRMEVPCCGGIENAAKRALLASGKFIPWRVVTVTTDGRLIE